MMTQSNLLPGVLILDMHIFFFTALEVLWLMVQQGVYNVQLVQNLVANQLRKNPEST